MCKSCKEPIRFYDNIPVISFIILKGRCRYCGASFSFRYLFVELLSGLIAVGTFLNWGMSLEALIYYVFTATLIVITFIDIDHYIIPDVISLPFIPLGIVASYFLPEMTVIDSLIGILAGGGTLFAIAWGYEKLSGKEGIGGGDIKLLAMLGAFTGWKGILVTLFIGSVIGTLAGVALMLYTRSSLKLKIPFGPFLSIGAITHVFFGNDLINWYWSNL